MNITDLELRTTDDIAGIHARVSWEDVDRPPAEVFIETERAFAGDLAPTPHAFLVGCLIPALHFGEKRLRIEGAVCPYLLEGLETVMGIMALWSDGAMMPLRIEATAGGAPEPLSMPRGTGMVLSGGIDSLAALRLNRLRYPEGHAGYIRDALLIHGFDIGGVIERGMKYHVFDRAKAHMAAVADASGLTLIPVYTNIRHLCDDRDLWLNRFFGAVLAAAGHAFAPRIDLLHIASSYDLPHLHPCGSHPLLDPEYGSIDFRIRHRDAALSRLDKIRIVGQWETALHNLRVCLANTPDRLNCGRCEKCVRTMLGLEALGLLDKTRAFDGDAVTPSHLDAFRITIRTREPFYEELLPLLEARGRDDLVAAIQRKLTET